MLEEETSEFNVWATTLGCPPSDLPSEDALKSIFKSRQCHLLDNMVKRVQPRQNVQEVRENILLRKMKKMEELIVMPACTRKFLPKEMQRFLIMNTLKQKKENIESRLDDCRREYDTLSAFNKNKSIQFINLKHKKDLLQSKVYILEFKAESLNEKLAKEEKQKAQILSTMPVKLTPANASEKKAIEAVQKALKELETFYNLCLDNNNSQTLSTAKDNLWQRMRQIFSNIPNFLLFNAIIRLKEDQLQNIIDLNKNENVEIDKSLFTNQISKEQLTSFDIKFMRTKSDYLGMVAKFLAAREERIKLEQRFVIKFEPFINELEEKVNQLSSADDNDHAEIISNYMVQYNFRNFSKTQIDYLTQQNEILKTEIANGDKQLKNHEVLLNTIQQVYSEINSSVSRVQYEMLQLGQIKEKVLYSKKMLKHMLDELQASQAVATNFLPMKFKLNDISVFSTDSFSIGGDDIFCSTKLDLDATTTSLNNTTLRRSFGSNNANTTFLNRQAINNENITLPLHLAEINTFAELPLEKLSNISKECAFYMSANPLIVESRELSSTMQLAPGILLTPFGALEEARKRFIWANLIAEYSKELKLDLKLISVDAEMYSIKAKQQREQIEEILDKIDAMTISTYQILKKIDKLYKFILDNPLRHFIPPTKTFQGKTYKDYETIYTMYYMMIKSATSAV